MPTHAMIQNIKNGLRKWLNTADAPHCPNGHVPEFALADCAMKSTGTIRGTLQTRTMRHNAKLCESAQQIPKQ